MSNEKDTLNPIINEFVNKISLAKIDTFAIYPSHGSILQVDGKEVKNKLADYTDSSLRLIIVPPKSALNLVENQFSSCKCENCYTKYYLIMIAILVSIIIFLLMRKRVNFI